MEKKRQEKADHKQKQKEASAKKKQVSESEESGKDTQEDDKSDKSVEEVKVSKKIAKHLGEEKNFQGWKKTCLSILKAKAKSMKKTKLIKKVWKVYQASK